MAGSTILYRCARDRPQNPFDRAASIPYRRNVSLIGRKIFPLIRPLIGQKVWRRSCGQPRAPPSRTWGNFLTIPITALGRVRTRCSALSCSKAISLFNIRLNWFQWTIQVSTYISHTHLSLSDAFGVSYNGTPPFYDALDALNGTSGSMNASLPTNATLPTKTRSRLMSPWSKIDYIAAMKLFIIIFGTTGNIVSFLVLQSKRFKVRNILFFCFCSGSKFCSGFNWKKRLFLHCLILSVFC